jgi:parvulin-like peptidyl-prolyl isomerase
MNAMSPTKTMLICLFSVCALATQSWCAPTQKKARPSFSKQSTPVAQGVKQTTSSLPVQKQESKTSQNVSVKTDLGTPGKFLLATVKGKELREDLLTTYSNLVADVEGVLLNEKRQKELLQDLVLQQVIFDVLTTLPQEAVRDPDIPFPYKTPQELTLLKMRLREKLEKESIPTAEQMKQWVDKNAKRFTRPEQIHAFHLFMQTSKDVASSSPEQVRKRMKEVKALADKGTSFALLAKQYSEAASGKLGGDIGWVSRRMPIGPEAKPMNIVLENALFELQPGQVSDIVQTSHGLHLLYCADRITTYVPTVDDLVSSHILPRSAQVELAKEKWDAGIRQTREKYNAKLLCDGSKLDSLTTDMPVVSFGKDTWTLRQLEELYGKSFTNAFRRYSGSTSTLEMFFDSVLNELAAAYWALDEKIDQQDDVRLYLSWLRDRSRMKKALAAFIAEAYPITEDTLRKAYEQRKPLLKLPEGKGHIISIKAEPTTVGMSRDEARKRAREKAQQIREEILKGADIEKLAKEVSSDNRASSGGLVERSVLAYLNDPAGRMFGAVASLLKAGEVSDVRQFGDTFVIVKLDERWEGEAPPFDQIRSRLETSLMNENEQAARRYIIQTAMKMKLLQWANPAAKYGINPTTGE